MSKIRKGFRKQRVKRPVEKDVPSNYDSIWEHDLHKGLLKNWSHHNDKISYVIHHTYETDFVKKFGRKKIILEAKGRFWDYPEYQKYIWIKKALPNTVELVFLFANPSAPMPQAKRRKDGTKRSHAEWAESNGFRWFSEDSLPDEWVDLEFRESETFKVQYFNEEKEAD